MEYEIIKTIPTTVSTIKGNKIINVPVYSLDSVPKFYCARYARLVAKELFDKEFPEADAWDMRTNSKVVASPTQNSDLEFLADQGILQPGMIIGLLNPETKQKHPNRPYTHMAVYLGRNSILQFAEQVETITRISDLDDFYDYHFKAKEVLDVKKS